MNKDYDIKIIYSVQKIFVQFNSSYFVFLFIYCIGLHLFVFVCKVRRDQVWDESKCPTNKGAGIYDHNYVNSYQQ